MTSDSIEMENKKKFLYKNINEMNEMAVAFSGGVDSSLLLLAGRHVLGEKVIAITASSETHPSGELDNAVALARSMNVRHIIVETDELDDPDFVKNAPDRCYHCKKRLFGVMLKKVQSDGGHILAHGSNLDDLSDYRPGMKAAEELGVVAPLVRSGFSKSDVRQLARQMGLPNWDRPSMACLATRIPYGTKIKREVLNKIDRAEQALRQLGVKHYRVRHYGNVARIEVGPEQIESLARPDTRKQIVKTFKGLGYRHISLDLEGYATGKMNCDLER